MRLRQMSFGEILDEVFRLYRRNCLLFAALSLGLSLPVLIVQVAAGQADQVGLLGTVVGGLANQAANPSTGGAPPLPRFPQPNLPALAASVGLSALLLPLTMGTIPRAGLDAAFGMPTSFWAAVGGAGRRYFPLFALFFMFVGMGLTMLTCVLIPLAVWILVRWSVAVPTLLAERAGPVRALARSWHLTRNSWWRIAGVLLVFGVMQYVAGNIVSSVSLPIAFAPFLPQTARGLISLSISAVGGAVVAPLFSLVFVVLYIDLRVRRESIDLWQLADQAAWSAQQA
jgi:hypothetical protein